MTFRTNYTVNRTPRFSLLSEDQKARIFRGVIKTLNDTGANVHHEKVRELLANNRCKVDGKRVRIPPEVVRDALASLPPTTTIYSWDGQEEMCYVEPGRSYFGPGPTPPNFIDTETLERRPYQRKDATIVARVCDALPNIGYVQSLGSIDDVTHALSDVYEFADMIQNTRKVIMNWAFSEENVRDEHRIGIVMAGGEEAFKRYPNFIHYSEPISPLTSDFDAIGKCYYCAQHRIPQVYTPCSIGGATVPATHAGQIITAMSESMVGVVVSQLLNPGTCILIGGVQSILDMRRTIYSYGAPELSIMSAAFTEMLNYVGLPMYSTAGCTDTKKMELQSGIEAAFSIHMAMMSGANFVHDNGYTESGITGDVFQTVMDDEIIGMSRLICGGVEVNEETLAVDEICNVGPGGHYLYEDHTMKWFRKHWQPTLMDRNSYEDWDAQGRLTMKDRIIKKTRDIIENHEGPISKVPNEAKKDIEKILDEAEERVRSKSK
ncbi:MAG: trimethylamine methyltransferase family protein [Desulfobacteraceae bacterium]|nr:trimethylamine methyltransferase family protein [Desulfobacteraceae bacterium]